MITENENQQHNNTPLISKDKYYPHAPSLNFSWLQSGATKKKDHNSILQQTPTEQQQQHKLNYMYLISLFNTVRT